MFERPTTVCVLTPSGRGAVATVNVEGSSAVELVGRHFLAASGKRLSDLPLRRIAFGRWTTGEELVVCRLDDDRVEIHCHGGTAAVEAIVDTLQSAGGIRQTAEDWARIHGGDLIQAEARLALAESKTERTAMILLDQYRGALRREVEAIIADLEHARAADARSQLASLASRTTLGLHLTEPWRVAIVGPPNVGKSSLMNALVGYSRSIVFDQPGTTRDLVVADTAFDGWPVQLIDTAGVRASQDAIESAGVELANQAGQTADLRLFVSDEPGNLSVVGPRDIVVLNKTDLQPNSEVPTSVIRVSAKTGQGLSDLIKAIVASLVGRPPERGAAIPFTLRQAEFLQRAETHLLSGLVSEAVAALQESCSAPPRRGNPPCLPGSA